MRRSGHNSSMTPANTFAGRALGHVARQRDLARMHERAVVTLPRRLRARGIQHEHASGSADPRPAARSPRTVRRNKFTPRELRHVGAARQTHELVREPLWLRARSRARSRRHEPSSAHRRSASREASIRQRPRSRRRFAAEWRASVADVERRRAARVSSDSFGSSTIARDRHAAAARRTTCQTRRAARLSSPPCARAAAPRSRDLALAHACARSQRRCPPRSGAGTTRGPARRNRSERSRACACTPRLGVRLPVRRPTRMHPRSARASPATRAETTWLVARAALAHEHGHRARRNAQRRRAANAPDGLLRSSNSSTVAIPEPAARGIAAQAKQHERHHEQQHQPARRCRGRTAAPRRPRAAWSASGPTGCRQRVIVARLAQRARHSWRPPTTPAPPARLAT